MLRYAISNRGLYTGDDVQRLAALAGEAARWAAEGIDIVQLREKDLGPGRLAKLACELMKNFARYGAKTRLLINARADVAAAAGAHGVHLTSAPDELTAPQVRALYAAAGLPAPFLSLSCHSAEEAARACQSGVDAVLFAPVFGKLLPDDTAIPGAGIEALRQACAAAGAVPVFALGGVTDENAALCLAAGAAGVAGIRLFHKAASDAPR